MVGVTVFQNVSQIDNIRYDAMEEKLIITTVNGDTYNINSTQKQCSETIHSMISSGFKAIKLSGVGDKFYSNLEFPDFENLPIINNNI